MPILGGSPLGIIGVLSSPTRDGMSSYSGGSSRNVNVNKYNNGISNDGKKGAISLFTGGNKFNAWANIGTNNTTKDKTGLSGNYKGITKTALHNNDIYDTSVLNIIEKLSGTKAGLRESDFSYLKDIGNIPNNRLVIARRFASPTNDNIFTKGALPLSVMMCYRKPGENFLDITFGEKWTEAQADFTGILNNLGKDFKVTQMGDKMGAGLVSIPLPGFSEQLQNLVLGPNGLNIMKDIGVDLPAGNPNIIRSAKIRETLEYGKAGSGLKCDVAISMVCEYEQKLISGVDPTIVWQDLLANILRFGTSFSNTHGLTGEFGAKINKWVNNPGSIITDFVDAIYGTLNNIKESMISALSNSVKEKTDSDKAKEVDEKKSGINAIFDSVVNLDFLKATIMKYRESIRGVVASLSGGPSTPWHVTIGNPMRPTFCSGDMLVEEVKLSLGSELYFNDLPKRVKVEFTLKNARPWGLQEILAKFNTGNVRISNGIRDFTTLMNNDTLDLGVREFKETSTETPTESQKAVIPTENNSNKSHENSTIEIINRDAGVGLGDGVSVIKEGSNDDNINTPINIIKPTE